MLINISTISIIIIIIISIIIILIIIILIIIILIIIISIIIILIIIILIIIILTTIDWIATKTSSSTFAIVFLDFAITSLAIKSWYLTYYNVYWTSIIANKLDNQQLFVVESNMLLFAIFCEINIFFILVINFDVLNFDVF